MESDCKLSLAQGRCPLVPCIAGARSIKDYVAILEQLVFTIPILRTTLWR